MITTVRLQDEEKLEPRYLGSYKDWQRRASRIVFVRPRE